MQSFASLDILNTRALSINRYSSEYKHVGLYIFINWQKYNVKDALTLISGMIIYALTLRSLGFLAATFLFLSLGAVLLGERRFLLLFLVSALASYGIWYLVDAVLGIYMTPFPAFLNSG